MNFMLNMDCFGKVGRGSDAKLRMRRLQSKLRQIWLPIKRRPSLPTTVVLNRAVPRLRYRDDTKNTCGCEAVQSG